MKMDFETIKKKITSSREYLRKTYGVKEIGVFGSFAGEVQCPPESDDLTFQAGDDRLIQLVGFHVVPFKLTEEAQGGRFVEAPLRLVLVGQLVVSIDLPHVLPGILQAGDVDAAEEFAGQEPPPSLTVPHRSQ